jgi:hypothetical protein
MAIGSANELFVGQVVANGPLPTGNSGTNTGDFTVRIDEVIRGQAGIGDLRRFRYVQPNWPWTKGTGPAFPACSHLHGKVGETVILALGARTSGGTLHAYGGTWYQPPTTFNTIGIVDGSSREQYGSNGRQLFSLDGLRELAKPSPPETDTKPSIVSPTVRAESRQPPLGLIAVAVLLLGVAGLWWTRHWR